MHFRKYYIVFWIATGVVLFELFKVVYYDGVYTETQKLHRQGVVNVNDNMDGEEAGVRVLDYKLEMSKLNALRVQADDPRLVELIRNYFIEPPSQLPYNLEKPEMRDPSQGQTAYVDKTLNQAEGRFYVDCGAHAGEVFSNTLFLERFRNWTGILIEASPTIYSELRTKHRKAYTLNACLNDKLYPSKVSFYDNSWWGTLLHSNQSQPGRKQNNKGVRVEIQCFPLYSVLLALNHLTVDYFSLDVEGVEEAVLDTIPWDKVDIKMMSIEYDHWIGTKNASIRYMEKRGYKYMAEITGMAAKDIMVLKQ